MIAGDEDCACPDVAAVICRAVHDIGGPRPQQPVRSPGGAWGVRPFINPRRDPAQNRE